MIADQLSYDNQLDRETSRLLGEQINRICIRCDRVFGGLFLVQWAAMIAAALVVSPRTWIGSTNYVHLHVWAAVIIGGVIIGVPILLIAIWPGRVVTRHVVAVAQMLCAAMLIHLTGGRVETHFHIFGSLAFLAFYRDWRVLITATVVVALDHMLRGMFWPQSVFGVVTASNWRWLEHACWVVFEDIILVVACVQGRWEMAEIARRQAIAVSEGAMLSAELTQKLEDRNAILAALDEGAIIATTDGSGKIVSVNDNFCRISGYSREELLGKDHRIVNSGYHPRTFWTDMYKNVYQGRVWRGEVCNRAKNGRLYWVDTTIKGVLDENKKLQKIVAVRADITDRKNAELQISQGQRLESIGQLAAGIAHEINTPTQYVGDNTRFVRDSLVQLFEVMDHHNQLLSTAAGAKPWSERVQEIDNLRSRLDLDFLKEEIPKALDQSIEGLNIIARIVGAMKQFSHPGGETKELTDINAAIESTAIVCRNRWRLVAELDLQLDPALPRVPLLAGDFKQVLLNLLVNAADALAELGAINPPRRGRIVVSTRQCGEQVEIRVQDNGPGIPPAVAKRIFEPFFTTKAVGQGTGQGLMLSRNVIVKKHGGELQFEPVPEGGTVFIVRLPISEPFVQQGKAA
jgi:PAS domain S-box-containing protein